MGLPRIIRLVHESPGRTRLRLTWLPGSPKDAEAVADGLVKLPGVAEVEVRPQTGSVLCRHDPHVVDAGGIVREVEALTGVHLVVRNGKHTPEEEAELRAALPGKGEAVARATALFFRELDLDVLRATGGHMDLATLTAGTFLAAGAGEIAATGRIPIPQWFNLAWWAMNTFTRFEGDAIDSHESR